MTPMLFLLTLAVAVPLPYSCGPFLLQPGTDRMTVVVDHETPVTAKLRYGIQGDANIQVMTHESAARHHVFGLTGLRPGTQYWYEITSDTTLGSGKRTFRTLPESPKSYRIVALGDVRSLPARWHKVSQRIFREEKDALFIIGTGDYPSNGRNYGMWIKQFFTPARDLLASVPIWPAIGNHESTRAHDDITHQEESKFFSLFELPGNERWYRVEYHLLTLLVLDSNSGMGPAKAQYKWLRKQLRSERKRYTLVAFHHAPFSSGPHAKINLDATPGERPIDEGRRFVVPLFEMYGVDLVLNGHDHIYERSVKNGITYVVAGGGGAPLYKINVVPNPYQVLAKSTNHYVTLDISQAGIALNAIDTTGQVIDCTYLAPRTKSLELRQRFIQDRITAKLTSQTPRFEEQFLRCHMVNPLGHPLELKVSLREGKQESKVQAITLDAGVERSFQLPLAKRKQRGRGTPWKTSRIGTLRITASGRDEALPIEISIKRKIVLRRPNYPLTTIRKALVDGEPAEFKGVPKIAIGPRNPIPRGKPNYKGAPDMTADLQLGLDDERLHLYLRVRDDRVSDDGKALMFESDSFHLVVIAPPGESKTQVPALFSFGAAGRLQTTPPAEKPTQKPGTKTDPIKHKARLVEGGYAIEASIPLSMLPVTRSSSGAIQIRFEIVLVDKDPEQAAPSLHRLWTKHLKVSDTSDFGILHTSSK